MKIAITSQNYRSVTPHAGKTRRFLVYDVKPGTEPTEICRLDLDREMTMHEFRGRAGAHPLDDMDVLITGSAGEGFVQKLASRGVRVIVTGETEPMVAIADFICGNVKPPHPHACDHHDHHHGHGE